MSKLKRLMASLLLLLCAVLPAMAEEKQMGQYIYVPAAGPSRPAGNVNLRVLGSGYDPQSGEMLQDVPLEGAIFGVYVISADGQIVPWADPLYPSAPMKIRSTREATAFSLPEQVEFYLKQESAPQGFLPEESLIPVTGPEMTVINRKAGVVALSVRDTYGTPIPGAVVELSGDTGPASLTTDERGQALHTVSGTVTVRIREISLPEGEQPLNSYSLNGRMTPVETEVTLEPGTLSEVVFLHPTYESLTLLASVVELDEDGNPAQRPLEGLSIVLDDRETYTTDSQGQAVLRALEGEHAYRLLYEGSLPVVLDAPSGFLTFAHESSQQMTVLARSTRSRIMITTSNSTDADQGKVLLVRSADGARLECTLDADGICVTPLLEAGEYVLQFRMNPEVELLSLTSSSGEVSGSSLTVHLPEGALEEVHARIQVALSQTFQVARQVWQDEPPYTGEEPLAENGEAFLLNQDGNPVTSGQLHDGMLTVDHVSGTYTLALLTETAEKLGIRPFSQPFDLPSDEGVILFPSTDGRLEITTRDPDGQAISGVQVTLSSDGREVCSATSDETGIALTAPLAAEEVLLTADRIPGGYTAPAPVSATVQAGLISPVELVLSPWGHVHFTLLYREMDAHGEIVYSPLQETGLQIDPLTEDPSSSESVRIGNLSGNLSADLKAGRYRATAILPETLQGQILPGTVEFDCADGTVQEITVACTPMDGAVRIQVSSGSDLSDIDLQALRFSLVSDEASIPLSMGDQGIFFAAHVPSGDYTLMCSGKVDGFTLTDYTPHLRVEAGSLTEQTVSLAKDGRLTVSKLGLTFDEQMHSFIIPLAGCYGLYVRSASDMVPYPSGEEQLKIWSNRSDEVSELYLPASPTGMPYYLRELSSEDGMFMMDEEYHEVLIYPGQEQRAEITVSNSMGFFRVDALDCFTQAHVTGGTYRLEDGKGETVLEFAMGEEAYQNDRAIPVGRYTVTMDTPPEGYALSRSPSQEVDIAPYLSQGGQVTGASFLLEPVPQTGSFASASELYGDHREGLNLVVLDSGTFSRDYALDAPMVSIDLSAPGKRVSISSVTLSGAGDDAGTIYGARVEYRIRNGGWQPDRVQEIPDATLPVTLTFPDVRDDISGIRIYYHDAASHRESTLPGFNPGLISLSARTEEGQTDVTATALLASRYVYLDKSGGEEQILQLERSLSETGVMAGTGAFDQIPSGSDGRVTGCLFYDENSDGILQDAESRRCSGLEVQLLTEEGDLVATSRTDTRGIYLFDDVPDGRYVVNFSADDSLIFTGNRVYSPFITSCVQNPRSGQSPVFQVNIDQNSHVFNAGCLPAASVSGSLLQKDQEARPVPGMYLELWGKGEPIYSVSGENGEYAFPRLPAGTYLLRGTAPEGLYFIDSGTDTLEKEVSVSVGEHAAVPPISLCTFSTVRGRVIRDRLTTGATSASEDVGLPSVRVSLYGAEGDEESLLQTVTTDGEGRYAFERLVAGNYRVEFDPGEGWGFIRHSSGDDLSHVSSGRGYTDILSLRPGEILDNVGAEITLPSDVTVRVFNDENSNGVFDHNEAPVPGILISLIRQEQGKDAETLSYFTDMDGLVTFRDVSPGSYVLSYQTTGTWRTTRSSDRLDVSDRISIMPQSMQDTGRSGAFTVESGNRNLVFHVGLVETSSLGGRVYYDDNANAEAGSSEAPYEGAAVTLLDLDGQTVAQTVSDAEGQYLFEGLQPGRYQVRFEVAQGMGFSSTERSVNRGCVQGADSPVSTTRILSVYRGTPVTGADAGVIRYSDVHGRLYVDALNQGSMADDAAPVEGASVHLFTQGGRRMLESTVTDAQGGFTFSRVSPGTYCLRIDAPEGQVFADGQDTSSVALREFRNNWGFSDNFELSGGRPLEGVAYGLLRQGSLSGRIWEDLNYDGIMDAGETGLRGCLVELLSASGEVTASTTTHPEGTYEFDHLMPGVYSLRCTLPEGYVYTREGKASIALRSNEPQTVISLDALKMGEARGELSIGALRPSTLTGHVWLDEKGKKVSSSDKLAGIPVTLAVTGGTDQGLTLETRTDSSGRYALEGVMPGEATLQFTLPEGYAFTRYSQDRRDLSLVRDIDRRISRTDPVTILSGRTHADLDAGMVAVGSLSGSAWVDERYNGKRDAQEVSLSGVDISLVDAISLETLMRTTTDESGTFRMDFVRRGNYYLSVRLPGNMIFTCEGESIISGVDDSTGHGEAFVFGEGETRDRLAVGAIIPGEITGTLFSDRTQTLYQADAQRVRGVLVSLMSGGTVLSTSQPDAGGVYRFDKVRPGTYRLRYQLPSELLFSLDSGLRLASPDDTQAESADVEMAMGDRLQMAGETLVASGTICGIVWNDFNVNGWMDEGETAHAAAKVQLVTGGETLETVTDLSGSYRFDRLRPGSYTLRFLLPADHLFTDPGQAPLGSCVTPEENVREAELENLLLRQGEVLTYHAGLIRPGEIGDTVWLDANANGIQDYRESLAPGISLTLLRKTPEGLQEVESLESDAYGFYHFRDLRPGDYVVRVNDLPPEKFTLYSDGLLTEIDSDVHPETGLTEIIRVDSGHRRLDIDIGLTVR